MLSVLSRLAVNVDSNYCAAASYNPAFSQIFCVEYCALLFPNSNTSNSKHAACSSDG